MRQKVLGKVSNFGRCNELVELNSSYRPALLASGIHKKTVLFL